MSNRPEEYRPPTQYELMKLMTQHAHFENIEAMEYVGCNIVAMRTETQINHLIDCKVCGEKFIINSVYDGNVL